MKRISIAGSMMLFVVAGLGLNALRQPFSAKWASVVFALTVSMLVTATLGWSISKRPNWAGFASFGWAALFLSFGPWRPTDAIPVPPPITTVFMTEVSATVNGNPQFPAGSNIVSYTEPNGTMRGIGGVGVAVPFPFVQTGCALLSLLSAVVGSFVALVLSAYFRRADPREAA